MKFWELWDEVTGETIGFYLKKSSPDLARDLRIHCCTLGEPEVCLSHLDGDNPLRLIKHKL